MLYHPHIHFLVTGGGIDASGAWRQPLHGFLVPAHALSRLFRARFMAGLKRLHPEALPALPPNIWKTDWVVDLRSVGSGEKTVKYLARYICRVALTDSAILHHEDSGPSAQATVTFRYRRSDTGKSCRLSLPAFEFLHRFLQHVLPKGFVKVRYYGLHHPAHRSALALARAHLYLRLGQPIPAPALPSAKPPLRCLHCRAQLVPGVRFRPGDCPPATGPPPPP